MPWLVLEGTVMRTLLTTALAVAALIGFGSVARAQPAAALATHEGDFVVHDFHFRSGETLPELRLHYTTLGTPRRDAAGHVVNAVLILHGTGGQGHNFIRPEFSGVLFGPGAGRASPESHEPRPDPTAPHRVLICATAFTSGARAKSPGATKPRPSQGIFRPALA